ncbi:MAG TPA: hypothetical protein VLL48_05645 [Longimicrobiales bacterium]|nr:hypothetical protein [Longimicrobiales bacterium]
MGPLPARHLGELQRDRISLAVPWTTDRVSRDATDEADTARVRSIRLARLDGADRLVLEFDSTDAVPGYEARTTLEPVPLCASGDSMTAEGEGLLTLKLDNALVSDAVAAEGAPAPDALDNIRGLRLACTRAGAVEWVLDVRRATYYRIVEAWGPPRLLVDVMHWQGAP